MVATSGWTLDPQGRAMSKSLGNVVDPVDIAKRLGAEIVRMWVASVDFREDVTCSEDLMQRVADMYRKVRNTFRYILGNLDGFDPARDMVAVNDMEPIDRYMLGQTWDMAKQVLESYNEFAFHKVYQRLNQFCVVDLSKIYFDVLKDRLYTFAPKSQARRSGQSAIWLIGEALVRLFAPLMSFTADEVWRYLPQVEGRAQSVHLAEFPSANEIDITIDPQEKSDWDALLTVRSEVLNVLEEARQSKLIGSGLEAHVKLTAADPAFAALERNQSQLRTLFIVSGVTLAKGQPGEGRTVKVEVSKAAGEKCERCWNYSTHVGEDTQYPTVCERCSPVLHELETAVGAGADC